MPKASKHDRLLKLGADRVEKIKHDLLRGVPATEIANQIADAAPFAGMKLDAIERAVRRFRMDEVDIPTAAKQKSIERADQPKRQEKILSKAEKFDAVAAQLDLLEAQQKRVRKWLESGGASLPSTAIRADMDLLNKIIRDYQNVCLETGLLRRVPKQLDIRAEFVVIDESNFDALLNRMRDWLYENSNRRMFFDHNRQVLDSMDQEVRVRRHPGLAAALEILRESERKPPSESRRQEYIEDTPLLEHEPEAQ